ncbi:hypothetical protein [Spiroplasma citri]|uniref:hypothetical protein n=1 Tax=Spiroplasma citri TaxID=2133 RepID=UPI0011BAF451|nr:hypothetical protein [Spiroplasma citri]QED24778.1 hypothetical protein FRX96_04975 [Spiroplasma citri]QIA75028.1 hypothetical protein GTU57_04720 [Spiroplasma citri]
MKKINIWLNICSYISNFHYLVTPSSIQIQQNTTIQDNSTSYIMIDEKDILINDISKQDK